MMDLVNKNKAVIAVILPILILILIREFGANHFEPDAKRLAEPSDLRLNIISLEQIGILSGEKLLINLGEEGSGINEMKMDVLNIPADSILSRNNLHTIRKHNGPILLFSSETAISARIWMVLSQMGYRNTFILTNDIDNEAFKSIFKPD